jgi:hypothetical protein
VRVHVPDKPLELHARKLAGLHHLLAVLGQVLAGADIVVEAELVFGPPRGQRGVCEEEVGDDGRRSVAWRRGAVGGEADETEGAEDGCPGEVSWKEVRGEGRTYIATVNWIELG